MTADSARPAAVDRAAAPLPAGERQPILRLRGIGKNFGAVQALTGVDLDVPAGQVTGLIGDNGAGKSTLIKTVSGIWEPDAGQMFWKGRPIRVGSPREAAGLGIATVYQDLALCDNLDIVQNMYLGHEPRRRWVLDEADMETGARRTLTDLRVTTVRSIRQLVGSLSGGQRQAVAVAKAVRLHAGLVIMDEPTAALGVSQTAMVLDLIRQLARQDIAVLVVSHNLAQVFDVADHLAVLRLGRVVAAGPVSQFDTQSAVDFITTGSSARPGPGGGATSSPEA